jgi:hypothetical protein
MRVGLVLTGFMVGSCLIRADTVGELARMHLEVSGGAEQVAALTAYRATGVIITGGHRVRFSLTAARPNRVRLEAVAEGRTFVQAYDGIENPWEFDSQAWPDRYRTMSKYNANRIVADAEYDDPLIADRARGYTLESAGEIEKDGRTLLHLRVRYRFLETFSLLLNPETYLIEYRTESNTNASGVTEETVTYYGHYQPVNGVLLPHTITTMIDGRVTDHMAIDDVEPNPPVGAATFSRPDTPLPSKP